MDISALRERSDRPMTVGELNIFIKNLFDSNRLLASVSVTGEISNFVAHRSGHLYFSLKDAEGQIRAVMFRSSASRLMFVPENGMRVTVRGSVTVFPRDGSYQIYVNTMQPDGIGALYLAYEQLKGRLESEGLFDPFHKNDIPKYPSKIGVITSPTGAAVRDIINVLSRRYPVATVYLYPVLVQGDGAEAALIRAVDFFDKSKLADTVIIGRGGGSIEDLWAFNSEALARRIFAASVPIISAVGHETDFTICDFVADLRAPTPSAAAELASPDIRDLNMKILSYSDRCDRALLSMAQRSRLRLSSLLDSSVMKNPLIITEQKRAELNALFDSFGRRMDAITAASRLRLSVIAGTLDGLNPLSVLARGFTLSEKDGVVLRKADELAVGDAIDVRFADGRIEARVEKIKLYDR